MIHIPQKKWTLPELNIGREIGEGLRFIKESPAVLNAMMLQFFSFLFVLPFNRLLPVYAKEILEIGPSGLGLLRGCFAGGNVLGGIGLVSFGERESKRRLLVVSSILITVFLILFSHASWLPLSLVLLAAVGMSSMIFRVTALSVIQLNVPDQFRGRVMGLYNLESGFRSLGGLLYGSLASLIGTPATIATGGTVFGILSLSTRWYRSRGQQRRG